MTKSIQLKVLADWNKLESVRDESSQFLKSQGLSSEAVDTLTMVISELAENAIKYGAFTEHKNDLTIVVSLDPGIATVEVINPVDEQTFPRLKTLDTTIQWIRGYQDPFEAYVEKLQDVSKKPLADHTSGLGLTRIAYEGKAVLDFFVDGSNMLNVSAVRRGEGI